MNNRAWIELVRPTSLLVVGDSTLRDVCFYLPIGTSSMLRID